MEISPKIRIAQRRRRRSRCRAPNQYVDLHWQLLAALADAGPCPVAGRPDAHSGCVHEHIHQSVGGYEANG